MRKILLAPSLLGADPLNISGAINSLENNFDWLHLDVMDGHFVKNLSFGPRFAEALRAEYQGVFIDAHLMTDNLDVVLPLFIDEKPSSITVHAESEGHLLYESLRKIKNAGIKAGVAICPPTKVASLDENILENVDLILVMSVTPGFGGQKFIEGSLKKVRELVSIRAAHNYNYLIEIDGGINESNIISAVLAGCDVIVTGSAVFRSGQPGKWLAKAKHDIEEVIV
ncbi:MAG: ribulose-phosphate 3-epimerase [Synergistaceae bacterium]|nr:ribulose-phosphate 3-epimerase [Synergistaceae bacterium]